MKIGEFANLFDLKKSTVRYYTDLNLLLPSRKGNAFIYDLQCREDMQEILDLKDMRLTIHEISTYMAFKRITMDYDKDDVADLKMMFKSKIHELEEERNRITRTINKVSQHISSLEDDPAHCIHGISLQSLELLVCPKCNSSLILENGCISNMSVISGMLKCSCGLSYEIQEGILETTEEEYRFIIEDIRAKESWLEKMNRVNNNVAALLNMESSLVMNKREFWDEGRIFFFNECDSDIFVMRLHELFREDCTYIFSSVLRDSIKNCMRLISKLKPQGNFIFLHQDGDVPLPNCIDRVYDLGGIMSPLFFKNYRGNSLRKIYDNCTDRCECISHIMMMDSDSLTLRTHSLMKASFHIDGIQKYLANSGFSLSSAEECLQVNTSDYSFPYMCDGEPVYNRLYFLKKSI